MKKSLVAVGVIVALGAAWTGASWYTGKQVEARMDEALQKANTKLAEKMPDLGLELQKKDVKRGIFSTDVQLALTSKLDKKEGIVIASNIEHGPFPLSDIAKFKFSPKLASIHSELKDGELLKELFEITKNKSLLNVDTRVAYDGNLSFGINIIPVDYTTEKGLHWVISGADITVDTNKDFSEITSTGKSDEIKFVQPAQQNTEFKMKNLSFSFNSKKNQFGVYLGDTSSNIDEVSLSGFGEDMMSINGIKSFSTFTEGEKNNLDGKSSLTIDGIKVKNLDFGSAKFVLAMYHIDNQAYSKVDRATYDALFKTINSFDIEKYSQITDAALMENLPALLQHNPTFTLETLSFKNSKGESTANFTTTLNNLPDDFSKLQNSNQEEIIRSLIKNFSLDIKLSKPMLTESIALSAMVRGEDRESADATGKSVMQMIEAQATALNLFTHTDDSIDMNLNYADDKVKFNGEEFNLHQFLLDHNLIDSYDDADEQNQHDDEASLPAAE
ncbi:hypothetical protein Xekj_03640 [Xenorhabdus sp. KJ12.1]|nr:hypothetical protein Xekj_03640 [Xenorhabdus sp. KJ12.1]